MKKKYLKIIIILLVILILTPIILIFTGKSHNDVVIEISRGDSINEIASNLADRGVVNSRILFKLSARIFGDSRNIVAGEFQIKDGDSIYRILSKITSYKYLYQRCLTFKEGIRSDEVMEIINKSDKLVGDSIKKMEEGYILPNTYCYTANTTRIALVNKMHKAQVDFINSIWDVSKTQSLPYKTMKDVIIMASIIEAETGVKSERDVIASVFLNRIKLGMKLQTDPTVSYGLKRKTSKGLTTKDLQKPTPYNTYIINGLPPTAINNPGSESIKAAVNPQSTKYLYFVATGNGGHNFSTNLNDHNKNVIAYKKTLTKK